jgi:hypothetical protein
MTTKVHQQVFFTNTPASAAETDVYFLRGILNRKSPEWQKNNKMIEKYKKAPSLRHKRGYKLLRRRAWSSRGEQKPTQIKSSSIPLLKGKNCNSFRSLTHEKRRRRRSRKKSSKTSIPCDHNYRFSCRSPRELARLPSLSLCLSALAVRGARVKDVNATSHPFGNLGQNTETTSRPFADLGQNPETTSHLFGDLG